MELIGKLNSLLEKNHDAMKGYAQAMENVKNPSLKTLFADHSAQRRQFAQDLRKHIQAFGGTTDDGGSVAGEIHRFWIDLKSAVTGNSDEAILEECIRGEEASLEEYDDVLEHRNELPLDTYNMIMVQKGVIQNYVSQLKSLEEVLD